MALMAVLPEERHYRVRQLQGEPLFAQLLLGDTLLASGLYGDAISWGGTHRQVIADWLISPMIIRLRQTHNEVVQVYAWLLAALDRMKAQRPPFPFKTVFPSMDLHSLSQVL